MVCLNVVIIKIYQANEANVSEVVLHANVESIDKITLTESETNTPVRLNSLSPFTQEHQYHFLKIHLAQTLEVGTNYTLYIAYSNRMNEGPMKRGIWRGWYTDEDGLERLVLSNDLYRVKWNFCTYSDNTKAVIIL